MDELIRRGSNGAAYQIAETYAWRGEPTRHSDGSIAAMRSATPACPTSSSTRSSKPLRGDPRYTAMLEKLGLPK
jgi:hypothetical protein